MFKYPKFSINVHVSFKAPNGDGSATGFNFKAPNGDGGNATGFNFKAPNGDGGNATGFNLRGVVLGLFGVV
jgi:hypothetical protein